MDHQLTRKDELATVVTEIRGRADKSVVASLALGLVTGSILCFCLAEITGLKGLGSTGCTAGVLFFYLFNTVGDRLRQRGLGRRIAALEEPQRQAILAALDACDDPSVWAAMAPLFP